MYVNKKIHTLEDFFLALLTKNSSGFAESEGGQDNFLLLTRGSVK